MQAYAAELSEGNRLQCGNSSKPLLEAVENLVNYASSPEFARVPAKISAEVMHLLRSVFFICTLQGARDNDNTVARNMKTLTL